MRIVVPKAVTDTNIIAYNLSEDPSEAWSPTKYYKIGDYAVRNHYKYVAILGKDTAAFPEFDITKEYIAGDVVTVGSEKKTFTAKYGAVASSFDEYNKDTLYLQGQVCKIAGLKEIYKCLRGDDPAKYLEWTDSIVFPINDFCKVTSTGKIYKSVRHSTTDQNINKYPPDNLTGLMPYWIEYDVVNQGTPPNLSVLCDEWLGTTSYVVGDKVKVTGSAATFECLIDNTNFPPQDNITGGTPKWKNIGAFTKYQTMENPYWAITDYINIGFQPQDNLEGVMPKWIKGDDVNYNLDPENYTYNDVPFWSLVSATNAWSMFDGSVSGRTIGGSKGGGGSYIDFTIRITGGISCLALFDVSGTQVTITLKNGSGDVISETIENLSTGHSRTWSEFFFGERDYPNKNLFKLFPSMLGGSIRVKIYGPIEAGCGLCIFGRAKDIGLSLQGVKNSITDYSKKTTSEFGVTSLSIGKYVKSISLDVDVLNSKVDVIYDWIASKRATPLVFIADNSTDSAIQYRSLLVYGFYNDFSVTIPGPTMSTCTFEIQGLI